MSYPEISEEARFPLLTEQGRKFLHRMREDTAAPRWNWPNGEQLDAEGLARVQQFASSLADHQPLGQNDKPAWLNDFVARCAETVPFYRQRFATETPFESIPSCTREDLATRPWAFVPDDQPLDQLIVFSSSGTTGHPAKLPTHPYTAACGLPLLDNALSSLQLALQPGVDQVCLGHVVSYDGAYTTATVMAYLNEAGYIRVNLHAAPWGKLEDREVFLNRWHPPILLGDPLAFEELCELDLKFQPSAMISSIATMSEGFSRRLQSHFGCPVIDLYALTEAGIVAMRTDQGHVVLPHDIYVEILDENDNRCGEGERGEVTLTGGRNPFCPLLRYRTGDYAALVWRDEWPVLVELEGREPVVFYASDRGRVHSMEISRALRSLSLVQYSLGQRDANNFEFHHRGSVDSDELEMQLRSVLGTECRIDFRSLLAAGVGGRRKVVQYWSEYGRS
jgi:phenylacetate-CoA ligase